MAIARALYESWLDRNIVWCESELPGNWVTAELASIHFRFGITLAINKFRLSNEREKPMDPSGRNFLSLNLMTKKYRLTGRTNLCDAELPWIWMPMLAFLPFHRMQVVK